VGPDAWFERNTARPGSWWTEWVEWLRARSSDVTLPPATGAPGKGFPPLAAAPGTYVHQL
jgi:polyhydroxyalkanoate synthase